MEDEDPRKNQNPFAGFEPLRKFIAVPADDLNAFNNDEGWVERTSAVEDLEPRYELSPASSELTGERRMTVKFWLESPSTGAKIDFLFPEVQAEPNRFLDWLLREESELYTDLDQGWMVQAIRQGGRLYLRHPIDWERCREGALLSVDLATFHARAAAMERKMSADADRSLSAP